MKSRLSLPIATFCLLQLLPNPWSFARNNAESTVIDALNSITAEPKKRRAATQNRRAFAKLSDRVEMDLEFSSTSSVNQNALAQRQNAQHHENVIFDDSWTWEYLPWDNTPLWNENDNHTYPQELGNQTQRLQSTRWHSWLTMTYPLNYDRNNNDVSPPSIITSLQYRPNNWFFRLELYKYLDTSAQGIWDPDFAYRFGYWNFRFNRLSLDYYNGGRNRINPKMVNIIGHFSDVSYSHLDEGTLTIRYRLPLLNIPNLLAITQQSSMGMHLLLKTTPKVDFFQSSPNNAANPADSFPSGKWKSISWHRFASLYGYYNISKTVYVATTLNYFPKGQRMDWHADYIYEFGLADWRSGKFSIEYSNFSPNNRFYPQDARPSPRWQDGYLYIRGFWQY